MSGSSKPATPASKAGSTPPRSIAELAKAAQSYPYDGTKSLKDILVGASALRKQGDQYAVDGDLENAFICYARAATIVVERVPTHSNYRELSHVHRHNLTLNGNDILQKLSELRPTLSDRFEKHQAQAKQTSDASAATNERLRLAREAQAREHAEKQAQREAAKRQAEENADAVRRHQEQERERRKAEEARRRAEEQRKKDEETAAARRRWAEQEAARRAAEDAARREEEDRKRWDLSQLQTSLGASTSAAAAQQQQPQPRTIEYKAPSRGEDDFFMPRPHPLESPREIDDSSSDYGGPAQHTLHHPQPQRPPPGRGNPIEPITTTSPPPGEPIHYPKLMSPHQRTQGYAPSLQSMFMSSPQPGDIVPSGALGLSFNPGGGSGGSSGGSLYSYPLPQPSQPFLFGNAKQPFQVHSNPTHYPYSQRPTPPPVRPPKEQGNGYPQQRPPRVDPPVVKASELPPAALRSPELKPVVFPREVLPRFVSIAAYNTSKNLETCGLLMGRLKKSGRSYVVTTLLIPKQHATSDTCSMDAEELLVDFQIKRDLIILGWIHTHPTQSCFMSSVDLHTHSGYQSMLPEAFAVVCAPKSKPNFGIFRLTDPPGIQTIMACTAKEAFHPHSPDVPIYTDADKGHVQMQDNLPLEIADLRAHNY
ncbi:Mov34-domain-containing protein [Auricularia subglabra TFB-10046 SS5]|nr:Mov34-domain-containing protein [Auricularia subglabra TFB-10046 SS5]